MIKTLVNEMEGTLIFKSVEPLKGMTFEEVRQVGAIYPGAFILASESGEEILISLCDFGGSLELPDCFELDEKGFLFIKVELSYFEETETFEYFKEVDRLSEDDEEQFEVECWSLVEEILMKETLANYEMVGFAAYHNLPVDVQLEKVQIHFNGHTYDLKIAPSAQEAINQKL